MSDFQTQRKVVLEKGKGTTARVSNQRPKDPASRQADALERIAEVLGSILTVVTYARVEIEASTDSPNPNVGINTREDFDGG